jgi:hypothetical protein
MVTHGYRMPKTTIQVSQATGGKLKQLKKLTRQPVGVLADIGLDYIHEAFNRGELVVINGKIMPAPSEKAA